MPLYISITIHLIKTCRNSIYPTPGYEVKDVCRRARGGYEHFGRFYKVFPVEIPARSGYLLYRKEGFKMSQIIVAQNVHGIVLAAENRAVQLDEKGKEISLQVNRLLPLSSHCALVTAGAAEGVEMGRALKQFIQGEKLNDVQELYGASLAFLSTEYDRFMRKKCELLPVDPIHQVSFILAGKTEKDQAMPFRLYFLWTKKKLPQLDGDEISHAFSLPRRMGLEFQLNKMCKENASLKDIAEKTKEGMERLKEKGEIGPALSFAMITQEGFQSLSP
jgi:hypothetical protein